YYPCLRRGHTVPAAEARVFFLTASEQHPHRGKIGEVKEMEVSTNESRRWLTPAQALLASMRAWSQRVQIRQEAWLLRHTTPKKLAWGGLFIALILLAFTWFDGPELLQ